MEQLEEVYHHLAVGPSGSSGPYFFMIKEAEYGRGVGRLVGERGEEGFEPGVTAGQVIEASAVEKLAVAARDSGRGQVIEL